jgi:hypothetical protein
MPARSHCRGFPLGEHSLHVLDVGPLAQQQLGAGRGLRLPAGLVTGIGAPFGASGAGWAAAAPADRTHVMTMPTSVELTRVAVFMMLAFRGGLEWHEQRCDRLLGWRHAQ